MILDKIVIGQLLSKAGLDERSMRYFESYRKKSEQDIRIIEEFYDKYNCGTSFDKRKKAIDDYLTKTRARLSGLHCMEEKDRDFDRVRLAELFLLREYKRYHKA